MHESHVRTLTALRKWSVLLDSAFRVPGTNLTFGLDPILGLIPGLGDLTTPTVRGAVAVPRRSDAHPARRPASDADQRRDRLARRLHSGSLATCSISDGRPTSEISRCSNATLIRDRRPTTGDWIFVLSIVGVLVALTVIPLLLAGWLLSRFQLF